MSPSIREMAELVFPRGYSGGVMSMLTAYFDDSGTHDDAHVVVYGGLVGDRDQWEWFDGQWKARLQSPLPGKPPLERFHMAPCVAGRGKVFGRYTEDERAELIDAFTSIILDSGVWGYARAVVKADWDALIQGDARIILGDPEQNCVTSCIQSSIQWAREKTTDPRLAFIFDNRPHRRESNERVFALFQRHFKSGHAGRPEPSIAFEGSLDFTPLQGADVVAWELYRRTTEYVTGRARSIRPRKNLLRLFDSGRMAFQLQRRGEIERVAALAAQQENLRVLADMMEQPNRAFPPALYVSGPSGESFLLEPVVAGEGVERPGLTRKLWSPIGPSEGPTQWPHPQILRVAIQPPGRSEESPNGVPS